MNPNCYIATKFSLNNLSAKCTTYDHALYTGHLPPHKQDISYICAGNILVVAIRGIFVAKTAYISHTYLAKLDYYFATSPDIDICVL